MTNEMTEEQLHSVFSKILQVQKKDKRVGLRLNQRQLDLLQKRISEVGLSITDYFMALLELDYSYGILEKYAKTSNLTTEELFGTKTEK